MRRPLGNSSDSDWTGQEDTGLTGESRKSGRRK